MKRYVQISYDEFNDYITEVGFDLLNPDSNGEEYIYTFKFNDDHYTIVIYSSITPVMTARDVGKDAIRTILLMTTDKFKDKPMFKAKRVHRTKNWQDNLYKRIEECARYGCYERDYECKKCGALMIGREGRYGFFYGCTNYPCCKYIMKEHV